MRSFLLKKIKRKRQNYLPKEGEGLPQIKTKPARTGVQARMIHAPEGVVGETMPDPKKAQEGTTTAPQEASKETIHDQKGVPEGMMPDRKEVPGGMTTAPQEASKEMIPDQKEVPGGMTTAPKEASKETIPDQKGVPEGRIPDPKEVPGGMILAQIGAAEVETAEEARPLLAEKERGQILVQSVSLSPRKEKKDLEQTGSPGSLMRIFLTDQGPLIEKKKRQPNPKKDMLVQKKQQIGMKLFV